MPEEDTSLWAQDEYHFYGQRANEHVMLVRNQHPIVLAPLVLLSLILLVIPYSVARFSDGSGGFYTFVVTLIVIIFYLSYHIYGYRNSISILTDQRILDVGQRGFFHRQISEAELSRIQDVSSNIKGIMPTMFGYGNVTIRTASKDSILVLENISDPYDVQQAIVRALKHRQSEDTD